MVEGIGIKLRTIMSNKSEAVWNLTRNACLNFKKKEKKIMVGK